MNIEKLAQDWVKYKYAEKVAQDARRECEDAMVEFYRINPQNEGTQNFEAGDLKVKIVSKLTKKIDSDKLQEIAAEHGLTDKLPTLFRWKAEINSAVWKAESDEVRTVLSDAITTSAGRPTFSIETTTTKEATTNNQ